jgi:hypothetical protein
LLAYFLAVGLPLLLLLLPCRVSAPSSSPPASSDEANSCTEDQLGAQELCKKPLPSEVKEDDPPVAGILVRGLEATPDPALFLPVTEPTRAEGIGLAPRLGDGLALVPVLISRRFRGRTDEDGVVFELTGTSPLEDMLRAVGIVGSGVVETETAHLPTSARRVEYGEMWALDRLCRGQHWN